MNNLIRRVSLRWRTFPQSNLFLSNGTLMLGSRLPFSNMKANTESLNVVVNKQVNQMAHDHSHDHDHGHDHSHEHSHEHDHDHSHEKKPIEEDEEELEEMFIQGPAGMEWGGPTRGGRRPEPTRYGDWERKGRVSDFQ
jgi:hypothetical protein